jgi:hypothetical protein
MEQNFKNHTRFHAPFHFFAVPATLIALGFAIYEFAKQQDLTHALIICGFVLIVFALAFARMYALKAQDRAIRAEEKLRYFILANKMLPSQLKTNQLIALRFASDEELVALVDKAIAEKLSTKEIKMAIKNWKADHHRI